MEFQEKLLNNIRSESTSKINKLEMTQIIVNSLDDLEKQGVIKILNQPNSMETIGIDSKDIVDIEPEEQDQNEKSDRKDEKIC